MVYLDSNSLIRFFTRDDPKKALAVKELLEKEKEIFIPEVVFPEIEYVLTNLYHARRQKILVAFKFLISRSNIKTGLAVKRAVSFFEDSSLDIADCLIAAHSLKGKLASFDKKLLSQKGVKKYW